MLSSYFLTRYLRPFLLGLSLLALGISHSSCFADDAQASSSSSQLQLYVNGHLEAAVPCGDAWSATGHTVIGRGFSGGVPADFVNGLVGDVRLYDHALTPTQIKALYTQGPSLRWQGQNGPASFDGTSGALDLGSALVNTSRSYTVSAWVMLGTLDGFQTFVSQDGRNFSGFFLQKLSGDNKFALSLLSSDAADAPVVRAKSSFAPQLHVLYHVVGVYKRGPASAASVPTPAPAVTDTIPAASRVPWDAPAQGQFVSALTQDRQGRTYIATEGQGVWRYDPSASAASRYTQFTTKEGLGSDDVYALLVDKKDRLWAGTLHGVSVYNGKVWKTYGPVEGVGGFRVFALASCPTTGDVWVATEGGLTRHLLAQDRWKQYGRRDGLPSDAVQALAFNAKGDVFVGTQADGIAVSTAQSGYGVWRTVGGPLTPPHAPSGPGLPTSLINCLLPAKDGTLYAGTDDGLAHSGDSGKTWRFLRGADWSAKADGEHPQAWLDDGLTEQADVRAIEVLPPRGAPVRISCGGAGTGDWGPDRYFDGGQTFHTDSAIDDTGLFHPAPQSVYQNARFGSFTYTIPHLPPGAACRVRLFLTEVAFDKPGVRVFNVGLNGKRVLTHEDIFQDAGARNKVILKEFVAQADASGHITLTFRGGVPLSSTAGHSPYELTEDYVTSLAEDGAGHLLVGHRQTGLEVRDEATGRRVYPGPKDARVADFITSLVPQSDGTLLIGGYGDGLKQLPVFGGTYAKSPTPELEAIAALPTPAAPPTLAELNAMLARVKSLHGEMPAGSAVYLGEDWQTQGDWVGRYGRQYAVLCAMNHVLTCTDAYSVDGYIGPNRDPADGMRWWTTAMQTDNPKALYTPVVGTRRQAEWDDHGEAYPPSLAGPDLWVKVHLGTGNMHRISLYFVNKDGHDGDNRDRDYLIEVKPYRKTLAEAEAAPILAYARVHDFWNGVYEQFAVKSPGDYYLKISRNNSHNTILSAVLIDKLSGEQTVTDQEPMAYMNGVHYNPPTAALLPNAPTASAALSLWKALDAVPANFEAPRFRLAAYRALTAAKADPALLADARWSLRFWTPDDRAGFENTMAHARQAGVKLAHALTPAAYTAASE